MTSSAKTIGESIKRIKSFLSEAYRYFYRSQNNPADIYDDDNDFCEYYLEKAFISTLVLLEVLSLKDTYDKVNSLYLKAKKEGVSKSRMGIEDPYLVWAADLDYYLDAILVSFDLDIKKDIISMDLMSILRAAQYTITDIKLFDAPPSCESDVHLRIEGLLKSIFIDLKHKPQLTKPIKNFEPDTGLPSIKTLIEYKYISNNNEAKIVAEQMLADTRGYYSRDWDRFIYVIYETTRIKPESEWRNLFIECNVENAEVVVISGVPATSKRKPKRKNSKLSSSQNSRINSKAKTKNTD
ncbi:MAG TPA: hypothetical protein VIH57_05645 [Bacteroidales bacterium]